MKIVWDEPKRLANIVNHGMDFVDLDSAFFDNAIAPVAFPASACHWQKRQWCDLCCVRDVGSRSDQRDQ